MSRPPDYVTIEEAHVVFANFSGVERQYNSAGDRNFCVILDPEVARRMSDDGWNIKYLKPKDDPNERTPYIQVTVGFKFREPRMVMVTSRNRTTLDEETCGLLDLADVKQWDVTIRGYPWEVNGNRGIKAYLKTIFVVLEEDYLELKYENYGRPALEAGTRTDVIDAEYYEVPSPLELEG